MASVAGMRRAEAAWRQFQADNPGGDAGLFFLNEQGEFISGLEDDLEDEADVVAALPGVAGVARGAAVVGTIEDRDGDAVPIAAKALLEGHRAGPRRAADHRRRSSA